MGENLFRMFNQEIISLTKSVAIVDLSIITHYATVFFCFEESRFIELWLQQLLRITYIG